MDAPSLAVGADLNGISHHSASPDSERCPKQPKHTTGEIDASMSRDGHGRRCQSAGWVHTRTGARAAHSLGGWSHPRCQWCGLKRVARRGHSGHMHMCNSPRKGRLRSGQQRLRTACTAASDGNVCLRTRPTASDALEAQRTTPGVKREVRTYF